MGVISIDSVDGNTKDDEFKNRFEMTSQTMLEENKPFIAILEIKNKRMEKSPLVFLRDKDDTSPYILDFSGLLSKKKTSGIANVRKVKRMSSLITDISKVAKKYKMTHYRIKKNEEVKKTIKNKENDDDEKITKNISNSRKGGRKKKINKK